MIRDVCAGADNGAVAGPAPGSRVMLRVSQKQIHHSEFTANTPTSGPAALRALLARWAEPIQLEMGAQAMHCIVLARFSLVGPFS